MTLPRRATIALLLLTTLAAPSLPRVAQGDQPQDPQDRARRLTVDFAAAQGRIRPLHGVNCGPYAENFSLDLSEHFRQLAIPSVRVHAPHAPGIDCGSIQTIFRNFDADADDPANYDFRLTDEYLRAILEVGAEPIFNLANFDIKRRAIDGKYRIGAIPPRDAQKWAKICLNIVRHYNDGWADGYRWNIRYWEVWNEPDAPKGWDGTLEQYVDLYEAVALAIKKHDPELKVGGPAACQYTSFLQRFVRRCAERKLPLDFCSWHCYHADPAEIVRRAAQVEQLLHAHGYSETENHVNEWSPTPLPFGTMRKDPRVAKEFFRRTGSAEGGAYDVAVLCYLQDSPVDVANFYSGDTLKWSFIDRYGVPKRSFDAFQAFSRLLRETPLRVEASGADQKCGLAVLAGIAEDQKQAGVLVSNHGCTQREFSLSLKNIPWKGKTRYQKYLVDDRHALELVDERELTADEAAARIETIAAPSVVYLRLSPAKE